MKTKFFGLFAVAVFALLGTNNINAQGLYQVGRTYGGGANTYVCETQWMEHEAERIPYMNNVRLRNVKNRFTGVAQRDGNGKVIPWSTIYFDGSYIRDYRATEALHNAMAQCWSVADKLMGPDDMLIVEVYADPATGKIIDLEFYIDPKSAFAHIHVERYMRLDILMKQYSSLYNVTDLGKGYNYIHESLVYYGSWFGKPFEQ